MKRASLSFLRLMLLLIVFTPLALGAQSNYASGNGYDNYCLWLKESEGELSYENQLARLYEPATLENVPAQHMVRVIYRSSIPDHLDDFKVLTLQKNDTACVLTMKQVSKAKKKKIQVHTQTVDPGQWKQVLTFLTQDDTTDYKRVAVHDGWRTFAEIKHNGEYKHIEYTPKLYAYLVFIVRDFYPQDCKKRR